MSRRRVAAVVVGLIALAACAGCSGSSSESSTASSTSAAPQAPSAWVAKWQPTLISDYGPAQQAFLTAIQSGAITDVKAAGLQVAAANAALRTAITGAGAAPAADAAGAKRLTKALATERTLIDEVVRTCTVPNEACQAAVTAFAEHNSKQIVPALTALAATKRA